MPAHVRRRQRIIPPRRQIDRHDGAFSDRARRLQCPFHRGEPWGGSDHNYACWWGNVHLDNNLKITSRFFGAANSASRPCPFTNPSSRYLPDDEKAAPGRQRKTGRFRAPYPGLQHDAGPLVRSCANTPAISQNAHRCAASSSLLQIAQAVAVRVTRWSDRASLLAELHRRIDVQTQRQLPRRKLVDHRLVRCREDQPLFRPGRLRAAARVFAVRKRQLPRQPNRHPGLPPRRRRPFIDILPSASRSRHTTANCG